MDLFGHFPSIGKKQVSKNFLLSIIIVNCIGEIFIWVKKKNNPRCNICNCWCLFSPNVYCEAEKSGQHI